MNPDEGVWGGRYGRLANLAADDTDQLWDHVVDQLITVKFSPELLNGFIRDDSTAGYINGSMMGNVGHPQPLRASALSSTDADSATVRGEVA